MVNVRTPKAEVRAVKGIDFLLSEALAQKLAKSGQIADLLAYSIERAVSAGLAPLTFERFSQFTNPDLELVDAYLYRYSSLVSNIQDSIFKSIGELEQEPVSSMSNRDKANLMERIGAVPSAETFSSFVLMRNKLIHEYPEEATKQIERINFIFEQAPNLILTFMGVAKYSEKFGISISFDDCEYLALHSHGVCRKCHETPCICDVHCRGQQSDPKG